MRERRWGEGGGGGGCEHKKILRAPCFIYHKIDQITKTEAIRILGFFFGMRGLLPMSEGDLKIIKMRMFTPDSRRLKRS